MPRSGSSLSPRVVTGASPEARLALVEFLLANEDLAACAQRAMEWLAENTPAEQSLCLALVSDPTQMFGIAGQGVSSALAGEFTLDLEDDDALARAARTKEPTWFPQGRRQPDTPLERTSFHAIPLRRARGEPVGLLLASATVEAIDPDVRWLAQILGEKLSRLRSRQVSEEDKGRTESNLGRERTLLHSIINAVTDPIMLTDVEGKLLLANTRAERLFSAPEDASEGWRRAVALNNMLFSAALTSRTMEHQDARDQKYELLLADPIDGSDLLFELLSSPPGEHGGDGGIVSVLRNVTDLGRAMHELSENYTKLRVAEAEARAERNRLDLIIDSVADPIVVTNPSGEIVLMNAPAAKLFTIGDANGSSEAQRFVLSNDARFSTFVSNLLFSGIGAEQRHRGELTLIEPTNGKSVPVEAVAGMIVSEQGEITAVVTILHDLTEAIEKARLYEQLKLFNEQLESKVQEATAELAKQNELLRRQAIQLEQASVAKSLFMANMSHEFRTPLNAILGYTNMLLQGVSGRLAPPQQKNLGRVDSNARHLLAIINDILDITRIEAGRMPLHLTRFALPGLASEVMSELEPLVQKARAAGVDVSVEVSPHLPPIRSDRQKVKQIVVNLLSNALKFTHKGSIKVRASVERDRSIAIAVKDTGIGIAFEDQKRVFEDFQQVDSSPTRQYTGTGLGLSICRRLATVLGGEITLESDFGKGSTFTLRLPLHLRKKR